MLAADARGWRTPAASPARQEDRAVGGVDAGWPARARQPYELVPCQAAWLAGVRGVSQPSASACVSPEGRPIGHTDAHGLANRAAGARRGGWDGQEEDACGAGAPGDVRGG